MAWQDWAGLGAEGLNWWQSRANYKDAQQAIDKGLDKGREDITKWQQPYAEFGNRQMQGYEDLGQFDFQFDQSNPSYQWTFDQGNQAVQRNQMAAGMAQSGNTLQRLTEYGQGMASQEYQNEFNRDLQAYNANKDYWGTGMKLGSDVAQNMGNNLADLSIMAGANKAQLYNAQAQMNSKTIGNITDKLLGQGGTNGAVGDALKVASSMGLEGDSAVSWVANKLGMAKDVVMGVVSGAADSVAGAAWGAFGAGPQTLSGGASVASGASGAGAGAASGASGAGTAGIGATLVAASPLLAFGAIIAFNELLGSSRDVDKSINKIQTSSDPLGTIAGMGNSELDALFARDESKITVSGPTSAQQKRGTMYAMILNTLPQAQIDELKQRDDITKIASDLFQAALSGREIHADLGDIGNTSTAEALAKLFPKIDPTQFKSLQGLSAQVRSATSYNNDYAGDFNGMTRRPKYVPTEELAALRSSLSAQIRTEMDKLERQNEIRSLSAV